MLSWLKKKPKLTPQGQYPPEIVRAIRTMADDTGMKNQKDGSKNEPLVVFQPQPTSGGAAFYAAPEIAEPVAVESSPVVAQTTTNSPFLNDTAVTTPATIEPPKVSPQSDQSLNSLAPTDLPEETTLVVTSEPVKRKKWLWISLTVLVISLGGVALWYWWAERSKTVEPIVNEGEVKETAPPLPEETTEAVKTSNYSVDQANLLSFDTESVTADEITTEFLKIALSVQEDRLQGPIAFLVRDQNYNPLAFSRFAYLLGLELDPALLNTLDEDFTLYFYMDGERPRMGLQVAIRDQVTFTAALKTAETTLPKVFEPFFLDKTTAPKTKLTFQSGLYQEQSLRYVNVDLPMNLSIDYALRNGQWLIGTSKNTLRALLDRPVQ